MEQQLRRCTECYAYVDSVANHSNWHSRQKKALEDLARKIRRVEQAASR